MNLLRALLIILTLVPAAVSADESCLVEAKVLKPQFAAKLPKGFKLVSTKKEKKQIKQVLKLDDGFETAVTVGGCSALQFTIELKGPGLTSKTVGAELVAIAKRELPKFPMDKDATVDVKLMLQALDEAQINVLPATIPCGNATCQLSLSEEEKAAPAKGKAALKKEVKKDPKKDAAPPTDPPGVLKLTYELSM
jgi:hypothetical protein